MEPGKGSVDFVLRVAQTRLKLRCHCIEDSKAGRTPARNGTKPSSLIEKRCHKSVVRHEIRVRRRARAGMGSRREARRLVGRPADAVGDYPKSSGAGSALQACDLGKHRVDLSGQFANRRLTPPVQEILNVAASLVS
jgi:hypothetical protein